MNWFQGRQTCRWHQTLISTGICARQETNKDSKDARELKTHIKFGADAALESKMQVIDGCCIIKVCFFVFRDRILYVISTILGLPCPDLC